MADDSVILQSELDAAVANVLNQYRANPQQLPPRGDCSNARCWKA